jgi:hypothetical protein
LRAELTKRQEKDSTKVDSLSQWKWMIAGGIVAVSFIITRAVEMLGHLTK